MHTIRLTPLEEDTGTRLDSFLSRRVEGLNKESPLYTWHMVSAPVG